MGEGGYAFGVGLDPETIRKIEEFNPTCVHFTVPDFVALDGIRWCQRTNTAYMATWHSNYVDYMKYYLLDWAVSALMTRYLKSFYEQIPAVYVPTPFMQRKMVTEGFGRFTSLRKWGRGCDLKIFSPNRRSDAFRASKGIKQDDVVILWVGRLVPEKRPDIWLYVVKRLQDEGVPIKAMVVGNGSLDSRMRDIKDLTCCGWLSGIALAEAYASCDVLLFPSGVETFGNVTLESLASGCVAIVEEKCSGHLVDNAKSGYTCPDGDYEAYYQATKAAVTDHVNRRAMATNAREKAWDFERSKIMQQMMENYKDAIMNHRDPSFIKRYMQQDTETAGQNFMATICCNYWLTKAIAGPFLKTSMGVQNVYHGAHDCVINSGRLSRQMSCGSLASLDYSSLEDGGANLARMMGDNDADDADSLGPRGGRGLMNVVLNNYCVSCLLSHGAAVFSYLIILVFFYNCFASGDGTLQGASDVILEQLPPNPFAANDPSRHLRA